MSKRARHLLVVLAATWLAAPFVPIVLAAPQSAPLVFMNLTRRDFGDVFAGEDIEQSFPVRNDGDAPLEIENKSLTGQAAPSRSPRLMRASAFQAGSLPGHMPMTAALRMAAPS
ncbi:MAG: hypothetical protein V7641_1195 [Blastocatellia bacterium]